MSHIKVEPTLRASDEQLIASLRSLQSFEDVARMLEIPSKWLHYILFKADKDHQYTRFEIPKKNGKTREILAPKGSLKILQEKINKILSLVYKPDITVHGFAKGKGIVTNAHKHLRKNTILNFDLENFFPSINFGRVRGVLKSFFGMSEDAATIISNICCHDNALPQGAPTSPILSNMVCFALDKELKNLAKQYSSVYTRYADDITFSTTKHSFHRSIVHVENGIVNLGERVNKALEENGFKVNNSKTRLHTRNQRLSVTGITVNLKLNVQRNYVKKVRAILRCLETNAIPKAQEIFENKYNGKSNVKKRANVLNVVKGMITYIGHVKGNQDPIYEKLARRYNRIAGKEVIKVGEAFTNKWSEKIWIVELGYMENDEFNSVKQGTGFFLKDVGFVTNAHVVEDYSEEFFNTIQLHRSRYGKERLLASIKKMDKNRDIVLLEINDTDLPDGFEYDTQHYVGQSIKVIGYPNFGIRDSLYVDTGVITQYRTIIMHNMFNTETNQLGVPQERIVVSARIVEGNSGGPVINMNGQVVGIATKGFKKVTPSTKDDETADNHVVQIEDMFKMIKEMETPVTLR